MGGDRGERGEHGQAVGPADGVEIVDLAALLAQPEAFGEEEEVELAPLGGLREVDERVELDLAARARVVPDGGVVHAGEVRGEDDLLQWFGAHGQSLSSWIAGGGVAADRSRAARAVRGTGRRRSRCGTRRARCSSGTTPSTMASRSWPITPGRSRNPSMPWVCHSSSRSTSSPGVPTKTAASERYGVAVERVEMFLAPFGGHAVVVEEHDEVGEDLERGSRAVDGSFGQCGRRRPTGRTPPCRQG